MGKTVKIAGQAYREWGSSNSPLDSEKGIRAVIAAFYCTEAALITLTPSGDQRWSIKTGEKEIGSTEVIFSARRFRFVSKAAQ